jgi:hypothetical protein
LGRFGTLSTSYLTPRFAKNERILRKIAAGAADSASKLSAFTFITPLFGVVASYVILHDTLTPVFGAAALLVIAGLYLVNRPGPARPSPEIPVAIDPLLNVTKT